jgi:hypothetical protein
VANRGIASLTHQIAISNATAARRLAGALEGSTGTTRRRRKERNPSQRPTVFAVPPPSLLSIAMASSA